MKRNVNDVRRGSGSDGSALERFVTAQARVYATALAELRDGRKRTHWIWFILPQLRGLGSSPMSQRYGLASLAEARAYLAHPVFGPRLRECVATIAQHAADPIETILGEIDALKYRSCLTLFAHAGSPDSGFRDALDAFYGGAECALTLRLLARAGDRS